MDEQVREERDDSKVSVVSKNPSKPMKRKGDLGQCTSALGDKNHNNNTGAEDDSDKPLYVMDAEWQHDGRSPLRNRVLGYAMSVRQRERSVEMFFRTNPESRRHRMSLGQLLGRATPRAIEAGILDGWPRHATFATFFGRGDYAALRDGWDPGRIGRLLRGTFLGADGKVRVDLTTDEKSGLPHEILARTPRSRLVRATDPSHNQHEINLDFMDVFAIVANGTSLAALGADLGYPKLALPPAYTAAEMERFQAEEPELFEAYAKRDALITGLAAERYRRLCRDDFGLRRPPRTLGGLAVAVFSKMVEEGA